MEIELVVVNLGGDSSQVGAVYLFEIFKLDLVSFFKRDEAMIPSAR